MVIVLSCANLCGKIKNSINRGHFLLELHTRVNALNSELQMSIQNVYFCEIKHWLYTFWFILPD